MATVERMGVVFHLFLQAAMAVRYGLDHEIALRALTINGARAIGIADAHPQRCPGRQGADVVGHAGQGIGPPLGLGDQLARSTFKTTLGAGESLWLYTDGLVERRGESVDVGLGRLREAIKNSRSVESSTALRDVYAELGHPASDDVAVVVLRR